MSTGSLSHLDELVLLVREGRIDAFLQRAWELEPADLADVLATLDVEERLALVRILPTELSSHALVELPADAHAEEIVAALGTEHAESRIAPVSIDCCATTRKLLVV